MNRTAFSLPEHSDYRTSGGLAISRAVEQFTGNAKRLDDLIELLDRRRGVVLSSGTTVPGRYESFDLGFQIEDIVQKRARESDQRDIVLYVPDRLLAYDRATGRGVVLSYDFAWNGKSTKGLPRDTAESVYAKTPRQGFADHAPGEYQATVEVARAAFARGDLFEAVPGQLFAEPCERSPAEVFQRLCRINPSPYGALMNLGDGEFLVSA